MLIRDFIFHDGTSYRNLIESIKNHTDELFIRHDVDSHLKYALKWARREKRWGIKSTYFLFEKDFPKRSKFWNLGHDVGLHILPDDKPPHTIPWTIHGTPDFYANLPREYPEKNNYSLLRHGTIYLSDSMGHWNGFPVFPDKQLDLFLDDFRMCLLPTTCRIFAGNSKKVHLLIHPNPRRWRPWRW